MAHVDISFADDSEEKAAAAEIERQLLRSLADVNTQSVNRNFVLTATAEDGRLQAGINAATSYGWLLIKTLWVDEAVRKAGLGTRLAELAEEEGRRLGCHGAWLDTSNAAARDFYIKRGYREFGRLENAEDQLPAGHCRWFLKKSL